MGVYNIQAPAQCGFRAKALSSVDSVRVSGAFRPALRTALPRARRHARCNTQRCARTGHAGTWPAPPLPVRVHRTGLGTAAANLG